MKSDRVPAPHETIVAAFGSRHESTYGGIRGDVFMELRSGDVVEDRREVRNIIVRDASILLARLMKNNREENLNGACVLAVGSGAFSDLQNPPAANNTQRSLYAEIARKVFSDTRFVDASGAPSDRPTNVVDFSTTFAESEAVGAIVEMALFGGNVSSNINVRKPVLPANGPYDPLVKLTDFDTQINYVTFAVLNKPATSTLSITWRLTF